MFLLICTLNILVIKQHLCKPIVKSILIGTKISQVVELQLKRVASKSPPNPKVVHPNERGTSNMSRTTVLED